MKKKYVVIIIVAIIVIIGLIGLSDDSQKIEDAKSWLSKDNYEMVIYSLNGIDSTSEYYLQAVEIIKEVNRRVQYNEFKKDSTEKAEIQKKELQKFRLDSMMRNEQKVLDYAVTPSDILYVTVYDDGTRRDGLAEYFYYQMKEIEYEIAAVKIVKAYSQKDPKRDNAYGILLGEHWAEN